MCCTQAKFALPVGGTPNSPSRVHRRAVNSPFQSETLNGGFAMMKFARQVLVLHPCGMYRLKQYWNRSR
jgi:hypothetical protein